MAMAAQYILNSRHRYGATPPDDEGWLPLVVVLMVLAVFLVALTGAGVSFRG